MLYDERYVKVFDPPSRVWHRPFDLQEIASPAGKPSDERLRSLVEGFVNEIRLTRSLAAQREIRRPVARDVGLLLPKGAGGYARDCRSMIRGVLGEAGYCVREPSLDDYLGAKFARELEGIDWIVVDVAAAATLGHLGFLQGRFMPLLRLCRNRRRARETSPYAADSVLGKDVLRWAEHDELEKGLRRRIEAIESPPRRITSPEEARSYFEGASKSKEPVFLSYAGADRGVAGRISAALKERFQAVFDYRDGESLTPGRPWLREIFERLARSALVVPLLSAAYFDSGNCEHEALEALSLRDQGRLTVIPVVLDDYKVERAEWRSLQYKRFAADDDPRELVRSVEEAWERNSAAR